MPRCEFPLINPSNIGRDYKCVAWINTNVSYAGCVKNHKSDDDFYKKEYRVYLNRGDQMWNDSRETIKLLDKNGIVIAELEYD
ncbi:hypothetical protein ACFL3E_01445 [Patescibacteria group bacterium]